VQLENSSSGNLGLSRMSMAQSRVSNMASIKSAMEERMTNAERDIGMLKNYSMSDDDLKSKMSDLRA